VRLLVLFIMRATWYSHSNAERWCLLSLAFHPLPSLVHLPKLGFRIYPTSSIGSTVFLHTGPDMNPLGFFVSTKHIRAKNWNMLIQPIYAAEFAAVFQQYAVRYVVLSLRG